MKLTRLIFNHNVLFTLAQVAWFSLLGIWIYWYVSNYLFLSEVGEQISTQIVSKGRNVFVLVGGITLLVLLSVYLSLLFHRLKTQFNMAKLYDNFIANVTHELKSPLASIQLALETMQMHKLPEKKEEQFIKMMLKDTSRLNNLINVILQIPALEHKNIAHNFQVSDMDELIRSCVKVSSEQFNLAEDSVTISGKAECVCVVDQETIRIVIDNLIDNAVKYSAGPPVIDINIDCGSKYFEMKFSDKGIGMNTGEAGKIFNKFYRVRDKNSPSVKGTGLGLYWVREIIRYHKGNITALSKGKNKGTTFTIELPLYQTLKKRFLDQLLKQQKEEEEEKTDE